MKKLMFAAIFTTIILASCGNRQGGNDPHDGMGAGSGTTDSTEEPMHPNDTTGMSAPVDTAMDTTTMP